MVIFKSNVDFTISSANSAEKEGSRSDINPSHRLKCDSKSKKKQFCQYKPLKSNRTAGQLRTQPEMDRNNRIDRTNNFD